MSTIITSAGEKGGPLLRLQMGQVVTTTRSGNCRMFAEIARREIRNGRQLGALVGLAPALYQSGATQRDRGITRAGNAHVRRMMVQLAWGWLRWQADSALAQWYQRRFATGGSRHRRIGIVALARKLLIALWRYGVPRI
jgi:transposase